MPAKDGSRGDAATAAGELGIDLRACSRAEIAHKGGMATSTPKLERAPTFADTVAGVKKGMEPYAVPYYITYGAILGAITVGFIVLTLVIVLVATNFNVLGLIE